ncbi:MAG: type II toxin-antitoxin system prevent-host-death family antitoxin [Candidatus Wolfebacteria bacterium]|nr:type II toxin-antitoxin system prevent-host-death family antitoxin [Candidatus Wolfebacteria bacterium]
MNKIVGLKELRGNMESYVSEVKRGKSFVIVRRSKPVFRIGPIEEDSENWEAVVDFTKIKKGGVKLRDLLSRL